MAAGAFQFIGGSADNILTKLGTTSATAIAGDANYSMFVPWFNIANTSGGNVSVTVDVYDGTTAYTQRPANNLGSGATVLFDQGMWLNPGQFIRVTAGTANAIEIVGVRSLPNTQGIAGS